MVPVVGADNATDDLGPGPAIEAVGWHGEYSHDSPEVVALRSQLAQHNGLAGLELGAPRAWLPGLLACIHPPSLLLSAPCRVAAARTARRPRTVDPSEQGYAERAARLFRRDGYVCVLRVLSAAQLEECRAGCIRVVRRILAVDPIGGGNGHPSYFHGTHRYSITGEGAVTAHMGATREFVQLADSPVLHAVLREVYGSDDWFVNGFGGDFCLPGAIAFQPLHSDQVMCCAQPRPSQWLPV
eukprot:COSAG01_NODE_17495_length_1146_cov_2.020057_2_plen_241_part_00